MQAVLAAEPPEGGTPTLRNRFEILHLRNPLAQFLFVALAFGV
jgi:hypothetical protein